MAYGAAGMGNLLRTVPDEESSGAVTAAWECGVRYFDVAPHHGLGDPYILRAPRLRRLRPVSLAHSAVKYMCLNCARGKARNLKYLVSAPPVGLEPTTLRFIGRAPR